MKYGQILNSASDMEQTMILLDMSNSRKYKNLEKMHLQRAILMDSTFISAYKELAKLYSMEDDENMSEKMLAIACMLESNSC